jgi:hypothetical protein
VALTVIAASQLMVVLDVTIVNIALPQIQQALGFSTTDLSWVLNAYTLTFGGLMLLGGRAWAPPPQRPSPSSSRPASSPPPTPTRSSPTASGTVSEAPGPSMAVKTPLARRNP